ncbi:MAG: metallophosphoesterase [Phyllobacterium sp.]|uniref:metallophosphoesterase family protein n=1 Tax=Phyllobacterium sp. TaxID=1871046 RepID=UPI0030F045F4
MVNKFPPWEIMLRLNILHLSDLHHRGHSTGDQQIVVDALKKDLGEIKSQTEIDLIVFSGDLVQAGYSEKNFEEASADLLQPVLDTFSLERSRIAICPGNHDIDCEVVRKQGFIETGLQQTLRDRASINSFIDQYVGTDISGSSLPEAFWRMRHFYKSVWHPLVADGWSVSPFSAIQKIEIKGVKIAVCSFNSSWRCTGEGGDSDKGSLIIGERAIDLTIASTEDAALRIAVFHHPLDWLVESDRTAVESRLHAKFDIFFYGHVHNTIPSYTKAPMGSDILPNRMSIPESRLL